MEDRVLKVLKNFNEDIILYDGNYMIEDGIVDSVDMIDIVVNLEKEFDISIAAEHIVKENFANKESIINFIKRIFNEERNESDKKTK